MTSAVPLLLAQAPLFGNAWLALLVILAGVAVFMATIAAGGRWLAATHPDQPTSPADPALVHAPPPPEILVVIAAAVAAHLGRQARIASIRPAETGPSVEMLMQQWSIEGRRQIYSSHQVR